MPSNLFPHVRTLSTFAARYAKNHIQMFQLPDDTVFVAANTLAMIYNWNDNTEQRLPDFPNGVRVNYPWSAGAVLLPLTPEK